MSMETWKPRRFVEEFQKRAGLLIDGKPGPQTQIALELVPKLPPGRLYPPVPESPDRAKDAPTPIDLADICPGDVVEMRHRLTVTRVEDDVIHDEHGLSWDRDYPPSITYHLLHRPDPDAEAVQAIRSASYNIHHAGERMDPLPGLPEATDLLTKLREQGWDVTRRQDGQEHA